MVVSSIVYLENYLEGEVKEDEEEEVKMKKKKRK